MKFPKRVYVARYRLKPKTRKLFCKEYSSDEISFKKSSLQQPSMLEDRFIMSYVPMVMRVGAIVKNKITGKSGVVVEDIGSNTGLADDARRVGHVIGYAVPLVDVYWPESMCISTTTSDNLRVIG